jgi:predicted transcriptional regulator YheO
MAKNRKALSARDTMILESYKTTMDGLAAYYGEAFEIVLHDLVDLDHSIIKIVNGFHSGRKEGAPITDFALSMLEKIRSGGGPADARKNPAPYTTYLSSNKYGKPVKSTTIVIFGENRRAIGLLCINFYLDSPIFALAPFLGGFSDAPEELIDENFITNSDELILKALEKAKAAVMADDTVPAVLKNKEIITRLYYQGIFKLKDAVITIAGDLNISKNTVYLHLRALEKN